MEQSETKMVKYEENDYLLMLHIKKNVHKCKKIKCEKGEEKIEALMSKNSLNNEKKNH